MDCATVSTKPLTKEETKILLGYIESSKIIYNKTTNATTNKLKNEEWKRIADQFNAVVTTSFRTPQQLRLKWENLKKNSRKRNTSIRMNNIKTGGGGPDYIYYLLDDVLERVAALLGNTVDGFTVAYGGDAELVPVCVASSNAGGGNESDVRFETFESTLHSEGEVLEEFVVKDTPTAVCSFTTPKAKPRASGFKRRHKSDENRAARNKALADYYNMKTKVLQASLQNTLLENKKLKLEIEKLQSRE